MTPKRGRGRPKGQPHSGGRKKGYRQPKNIARAAGEQLGMRAMEITAAKVLEEMARIAYFDPRQLVDAAGKRIPLHLLPAHVASAISSIETLRVNLTTGDDAQETLHRTKTHDKLKALEMLGKHLKIITDNVVTGELDDWERRAADLASARRRDKP